MTISAKLALGLGTMVLLLGICGAVSLRNLAELRATDAHVQERVSFNELAVQYRHAAMDAMLGAWQLSAGNVMGDQRIREGIAAMERSRKSLRKRSTGSSERRELAEIERIDRLTLSALERVLSAVNGKQPALLQQQELAFLTARADALDLRLDALFEESREEVDASMRTSAELGERVRTQSTYALSLCVVLSVVVALLIQRAIARLDGSLRGATSALDGRHRDLRLVLDHVHQGLLMLRRDGTTLSERSAKVNEWLGAIATDLPLWQALRGRAPAFASALQVGFEAILKDGVPRALTLDQMPKSLELDGRHLQFEYRPILEGEQLAKLLVLITDVSERISSERDREREAMGPPSDAAHSRVELEEAEASARSRSDHPHAVELVREQ